MPVTDFGLTLIGSYIKGDAPQYPNYLEFGSGSTTFIGSTNYLDNGFLRNAITWSWAGAVPKGTVLLLTTDANGSTINEIGLGVGNTVGSTLFTRDLSAIGDKNTSFSTTLTFNVLVSRP
jgi:hypothetical protein